MARQWFVVGGDLKIEPVTVDAEKAGWVSVDGTWFPRKGPFFTYFPSLLEALGAVSDAADREMSRIREANAHNRDMAERLFGAAESGEAMKDG